MRYSENDWKICTSVICTGVTGIKLSPIWNFLGLFTAIAKLCCQYLGLPFGMWLQKPEFYAGARTLMCLVLKRNVVKATLKSWCREFSSESNKMSLKVCWAYHHVGWVVLQDLQLHSITCSWSAQENAAPAGLCGPGLPQQLWQAGGHGAVTSPSREVLAWQPGTQLAWNLAWSRSSQYCYLIFCLKLVAKQVEEHPLRPKFSNVSVSDVGARFGFRHQVLTNPQNILQPYHILFTVNL